MDTSLHRPAGVTQLNFAATHAKADSVQVLNDDSLDGPRQRARARPTRAIFQPGARAGVDAAAPGIEAAESCRVAPCFRALRQS